MVYEKIRNLLATILGVDEDQITPNTTLYGHGGVPSIELAKLMINCEKSFHITIEDEDVCDFVYLTDLVQYVRDKLADGRDDYSEHSEERRQAWFYE